MPFHEREDADNIRVASVAKPASLMSARDSVKTYSFLDFDKFFDKLSLEEFGITDMSMRIFKTCV